MNPKTLLPALLLTSSAPFADVLVVDAAGGGDFTTLTAAVAAAVEADVVLVRAGSYTEPGPVEIDDKPITIVGDGPAELFSLEVTVQPGLAVRNLGPGRHVVLQNLEFLGTPGSATTPATPAMLLENNQGHVRVQNCAVVGGSGADNAHPDGAVALHVSACDTVALVGTRVEGGSGQYSPHLGVVTGHGATAILLDGGELAVYGGWITGGWGGSNQIGGWPDGGDGGQGLEVTSGKAFLSGAGPQGGGGGIAHHGGDGGDGVVVGSGGQVLLMAGSFASGGEGGWSDEGPDGADGAALVDPFANVDDLGGTYHDFSVTTPLREGEAGTLDFGGQLSDTVVLAISAHPQADPHPLHQGTLLVATPLAATLTFASAGNLDLDFDAPALPSVLSSLDLQLQPLYVGTDGFFLGPAQVLMLLDGAF